MAQQFQEINDLWKPWYEAQLQEIRDHQKRYVEEKPTLLPVEHFNPEGDVDVLKKALKGLGTNEELVIEILTKRSLQQRIEIQNCYQVRHGRDLAKDLKEELSGKFEKVILALLKPLPLYYAEQIKVATDGAGIDETALIEIFCTRDDDFIKIIKVTFENEYGTPLEKVILKDTSGNFEKLLVATLALCRDDSKSTPEKVLIELCAEDINEAEICRIVTSYSHHFLHRVFKKYEEKFVELTFLDLVEKVCSHETRVAYKAIYLSSKSKADFFAYAIHNAVEGSGTDDSTLIRIIVSRCEIDLGTIKKKYYTLYETCLVERVKADVSGDYGKALLYLLGCFD